MNTIEIATTHNIIFRYVLANPIQRALAFAADLFIVFIYMVLVTYIFNDFKLLRFLFIFPVITFYHLTFEMFNHGQSPGKMLVNLRVISLNGSNPTPGDFFMRWVFRLIDIFFSLGSIGLLYMTSSEKNQRMGDVLAQTAVISLQSDLSLSLKSIAAEEIYEEDILYPGIVRYNDQDMLLLKQSLSRYQLYPNPHNESVVLSLAKKMSEDLQISLKETVKIDFMKRALREYVYLTRRSK